MSGSAARPFCDPGFFLAGDRCQTDVFTRAVNSCASEYALLSVLSVLASLWLLHRPTFCPCFSVVTLQTSFCPCFPVVTLQTGFLSLLLCGYFTDLLSVLVSLWLLYKLLSVLASLWLLYRLAFCPCFSVATLQTGFLSLLLCGYFTDRLFVLVLFVVLSVSKQQTEA